MLQHREQRRCVIKYTPVETRAGGSVCVLIAGGLGLGQAGSAGKSGGGKRTASAPDTPQKASGTDAAFALCSHRAFACLRRFCPFCPLRPLRQGRHANQRRGAQRHKTRDTRRETLPVHCNTRHCLSPGASTATQDTAFRLCFHCLSSLRLCLPWLRSGRVPTAREPPSGQPSQQGRHFHRRHRHHHQRR